MQLLSPSIINSQYESVWRSNRCRDARDFANSKFFARAIAIATTNPIIENQLVGRWTFSLRSSFATFEKPHPARISLAVADDIRFGFGFSLFIFFSSSFRANHFRLCYNSMEMIYDARRNSSQSEFVYYFWIIEFYDEHMRASRVSCET